LTLFVLKSQEHVINTIFYTEIIKHIRYQAHVTGDKLNTLNTKLDVVKTVMQDNIQQLLANGEQVSRISTQAETLNEQSAAFKSSTRELSAKMYWKMWKMRILIAFVVIVVLIIIIVPVALTANTAKNASGR
jgi:hypothetical protein